MPPCPRDSLDLLRHKGQKRCSDLGFSIEIEDEKVDDYENADSQDDTSDYSSVDVSSEQESDRHFDSRDLLENYDEEDLHENVRIQPCEAREFN